MNKYCTRFKDPVLEKQYLVHKVKVIQFPILTYLTIGATMILLANSIVYLINIDYKRYLIIQLYTNALITGSIMTYLLLQYIVLRRNESLQINYCNFALMLTNFASLVFEIQIYPYYDYYDGYLLGSNQMLVHTILMFACNLEIGIFSNIILTIVRVIINVESSDNLTAQQYLYSIIVSLSFMMIQYQIEKQYRQSFFLQFKDNSWGINYYHQYNRNLNTIAIEQTLFHFYFQQRFQYVLNDNEFLKGILQHRKTTQYSIMINKTDTFLFKSKVKQQTLEQYLIKKTHTNGNKKSSSCLFNYQIVVEYQMKKLLVSIVCCKFEQLIYTITIDSEDPLINQTNKKLNQALQHSRNILNTQLLQINKILGVYLQDTFSPLLRDLRISLFQVYYRQISNQKLQLVKMKKLLLKCSKIFETPFTKIKIDCSEQIRFVTLKSTLIIFLFEIFKQVDKNQQVSIFLNQNKTTTMFIYGLKQLPKTVQFVQCQQTLIDKTNIESQYFSFEFLKSPSSHFSFENHDKQKQLF